MGILKNIFGNKAKKDTETKDSKPHSTFNFDLLVEKARTTNEIIDLNNLYSSFLNLDKWSFIVSKNSSIEDAKPFIALVDEKPWLFVFTDSEKANLYAKTFGGFFRRKWKYTNNKYDKRIFLKHDKTT